MDADKIAALRRALSYAPDNHALRQLLAETLEANGDFEGALDEYSRLIEADAIAVGALIAVGNLAVEHSRLALASACLDAAARHKVVEGISGLRRKLDEALEAEGYSRVLLSAAGGVQPKLPDMSNTEAVITFADVGGLAEVKKTVHKLIILPFLRPDLYRRYGRSSGGGVLLYGPPGCGKTMLARATAGECQLPFVNVRLENVLDPFMGVSERNLHQHFEVARSQAPVVLFLDELDALAYARRKRLSDAGQALVGQLLQELDAIGAENRSMLTLAATNEPWNVDDALLRPGRFDRRIFVPPPDEDARLRILQLCTTSLAEHRATLSLWAKKAAMFSGADLRALVDMAIDYVIDEALESGDEPALSDRHFEEAFPKFRPTTVEWLRRARNHVEFANADGRYDEVDAYVRSREVRRHLK